MATNDIADDEPHEPDGERSPEGEADLPDMRGLVIKAGIGMGLLVIVLGGLSLVFRSELVSLGAVFVETLGALGVFLSFFLPDGFALPIPQDVFTGLALVGGMAFWPIVGYASLGAMAGGVCGFYIGRRLGWTRWYRRMTRGRGRQIHNMVERYGVTAVLIGAVSPLPYWIVCWTCGAMGMRFRPFILVSLTRIPRIAFYLWLIDLGFIAVD